MLNVYILSYNTIIKDSIFQKLNKKIPKSYQKKITAKLLQRDKDIALLSYLYLIDILINDFQISDRNIVFQYNKYGKPYLKDYHKIFFNISHSLNNISIAFSDHEVGIDIEQNRNVDVENYLHHLHTYEQQLIRKAVDINTAFFKIWSLKESYIKALGIGLYKPLQSFSVFDQRSNLKIYDESTDQQNHFSLHYQQLSSGTHLAVCYEEGLTIDKQTYTQCESFLSKILLS